MKKRLIPNTDIEVSPICMGTMNFGVPIDESDAIKLVHYTIERGINFIDTANAYEGYNRKVGSPGGVAESILGKALLGKREKVFLATKVGMKVGSLPEDEGTSPAAIKKHLALSLKRLATDYIDIYYLHKPDPGVPMADILGALYEAKIAGKIKHYGVSNYSAEQVATLLKVADNENLPRPVIHQPAYSLLNRTIENDLLPLCMRENISVAPYKVLHGGVLTGKYKRNQSLPPDSRKAEKSDWMQDFDEQLFDRLEQIEKEAKDKGETMMEYSLKYVLQQQPVVALILGVKSIEQLASLISLIV